MGGAGGAGGGTVESGGTGGDSEGGGGSGGDSDGGAGAGSETSGYYPCEPGSFALDEAGTACQFCSVGEYCPGGFAPPEACVEGTFDHDSDPATPCIKWTESCEPGQYAAMPGTPTSDRVCASCDEGMFSTLANAASCTPWTDCTPGQTETKAGTTTSDRECTTCASGTFDHDADPTTQSVQSTHTVVGSAS
jgi:hypothetical protein